MDLNKGRYHKIIAFTIITTLVLMRFYLLGYSNFKGDEVNTLNLLFSDGNILEQLYSNLKGPGQYILSYSMYLLSNPETNTEFLVRLPYATANALSLIFVYLSSAKILSKRASLLAITVYGLSGLAIAFGRISQYQSIILLIGSITLWLFTKKRKAHHIYTLGLLHLIGLSFHYDMISIIIPTLIFMKLRKYSIIDLFKYLLILSITLAYYVPYLLSNSAPDVLHYLINDRALGNFGYDSVFYSVKLLSVYHPREWLILMLIGLILWMTRRVWKYSSNFIRFLLSVTLVLVLARYFNETPRRLFIYPSIFLGIGLGIWALYKTYKQKVLTNIFYAEVWFVFSFITYILILKKPLTHIYVILIPASVLVAYGFRKILKNKLYVLLVSYLLIAILSFNYKAFYQLEEEYPWSVKKYIGGHMYQEIAKGEKVRGIFGFPYYRGLENLEADLYKQDGGIEYFISNEEFKVMRYYMRNYQLGENEPHYYIEVLKTKSEPRPNKSNYQKLINNEHYVIYKSIGP